MKLARVLCLATLVAACSLSLPNAEAALWDIKEHPRVGVIMIPTTAYYLEAREVCRDHVDRRKCMWLAEGIKHLGDEIRNDLVYNGNSLAAGDVLWTYNHWLNERVAEFQINYKGVGR